jgi:hypothetical protein
LDEAWLSWGMSRPSFGPDRRPGNDPIRRDFTKLNPLPKLITDDDLHARVMTPPIGEYVGGAIVEQIDWSVRLEIEEQRAVAALLPSQGDVVNTEYPWPMPIVGIRERMQEPQEYVWTDGHARTFRVSPAAALAAGLHRERRQQIGGAVGSAR